METTSAIPTGTLRFHLTDAHGEHAAIGGAPVQVFSLVQASDVAEQTAPPAQEADRGTSVCTGKTDVNGYFTCDLPQDSYRVWFRAFGKEDHQVVPIDNNLTRDVEGKLPIGFSIETGVPQDDCTTIPSTEVREGKGLYVRVARNKDLSSHEIRVTASSGAISNQYKDILEQNRSVREYIFDSARASGRVRITATLRDNPEMTVHTDITVIPNVQNIAGDVTVTMRRAAAESTEDLSLWVVIRKSTEAISFNNYFRFMNHVLCGEALSPDLTPYEHDKIVNEKKPRFDELQKKRFLPFTDSEAYRILKIATEAFLVVNCGVSLASESFPFTDDDIAYLKRRSGLTADLRALWGKYLKFVNGTENQTLPYLALIRDKLRDVRLKDSFFADADLPQECFGILRQKLTESCLLELIW